jgi:sensor c-di-GMP phosphodiesterase-like protein
MQGIYATRQLTPDEQANLLAFFAAADQQGEPRTSQNLLLILGGGTGLAGVLFLGMTLFWPRQRLSIAQRLRKYGKL